MISLRLTIGLEKAVKPFLRNNAATDFFTFACVRRFQIQIPQVMLHYFFYPKYIFSLTTDAIYLPTLPTQNLSGN
jgi:hypothetical protein